MSDSESDFMDCTPSEVVEDVKGFKVHDLVPTKSGSIYQAAYQKFIKWCQENNVNNYSESSLLGYFTEMETKVKMKGSTMWSYYSMIKSLLNAKHGVDISKYSKLRAYLKKQNQGHTPKKSRVFTKAQFEKFLSEASDENYLGMKIVLIIGISGACRCDEMVKMKIDDIEDLGSLLHVKIPDSKTTKARSFIVVGENFINIYRKYVSLRPERMNDRRLFVKYSNGKCHRVVMGIHKIGSVPREVASYLKLSNWKEYTGHSLRRTAATLVVDGGPDLSCLKRNGGWKSNSVAEGYIEKSLTNQKEIAMKILSPNPNSEDSSSRSDAELSLAESAMGNSNIKKPKLAEGAVFPVHPEYVSTSRVQEYIKQENAECDAWYESPSCSIKEEEIAYDAYHDIQSSAIKEDPLENDILHNVQYSTNAIITDLHKNTLFNLICGNNTILKLPTKSWAVHFNATSNDQNFYTHISISEIMINAEKSILRKNVLITPEYIKFYIYGKLIEYPDTATNVTNIYELETLLQSFHELQVCTGQQLCDDYNSVNHVMDVNANVLRHKQCLYYVKNIQNGSKDDLWKCFFCKKLNQSLRTYR